MSKGCCFYLQTEKQAQSTQVSSAKTLKDYAPTIKEYLNQLSDENAVAADTQTEYTQYLGQNAVIVKCKEKYPEAYYSLWILYDSNEKVTGIVTKVLGYELTDEPIKVFLKNFPNYQNSQINTFLYVKTNGRIKNKIIELEQDGIEFSYSNEDWNKLGTIYTLTVNLSPNYEIEQEDNAEQNHSSVSEKLSNVGDIITFGSYEQDNDISNGKEEIEWLILAKDDNKVLIISDKALDCMQYNTVEDYVTWETCSLRKWLNNDFYNEAFNNEEQAKIQNTNVLADKNPKYNTNPGNSTLDKVFLLSINEVRKYLNDLLDKKCVPSKYAIYQGAYKSSKYTKNGTPTCWWWLRSPGHSEYCAASVSHDGIIGYGGGEGVSCYGFCVRPSMWIILE